MPVATAPPRVVRLTGTDLAPRWRGRLHLAAAFASVPAAARLLQRAHGPAVDIYAVGLVVLFAVSSAYHLLPVGPVARRRLRRADHVMIYLFTAACYGPFCLRVAPGAFGVAVLAAVWVGALAGVGIKMVGFHRMPVAGSVLYVVLGWMAALVIPDAAHVLSVARLALIAGTGLTFSAGAVVLFTRRPDPVPHIFGYHEVWHALVVAGAACWYVLVWQLTR